MGSAGHLFFQDLDRAFIGRVERFLYVNLADARRTNKDGGKVTLARYGFRCSNNHDGHNDRDLFFCSMRRGHDAKQTVHGVAGSVANDVSSQFRSGSG